MKSGLNKTLILFAIMLGVFASGCGGDDADKNGSGENAAKQGEDHDHDHDDHDAPKSLGEAVATLEAEFEEIKDAFANNDTSAADGPVHEVGHILEHVKELAEEASLPEDKMAALTTAVDDLFTHFGELDKQIHAGANTEFADLEPKISTALTELKAAIQDQA